MSREHQEYFAQKNSHGSIPSICPQFQQVVTLYYWPKPPDIDLAQGFCTSLLYLWIEYVIVKFHRNLTQRSLVAGSLGGCYITGNEQLLRLERIFLWRNRTRLIKLLWRVMSWRRLLPSLRNM